MEDLQAILITVGVGAVAGFLAGQLVKGEGLGLVRNIVVGILGAVITGYFFGDLELIEYPVLNQILGATVGAVILLVAVSLIRKAVGKGD